MYESKIEKVQYVSSDFIGYQLSENMESDISFMF